MTRHDPSPSTSAPLTLADVLPDMSVLDRLLVLTGPASGEFLFHLGRDLASVETGLRAATESADIDWTRIRAETHVLISLAGAVGATPLYKLAVDLNRAGHEQDDSCADMAKSGLAMLTVLIAHVQTLTPPATEGPEA